MVPNMGTIGLVQIQWDYMIPKCIIAYGGRGGANRMLSEKHCTNLTEVYVRYFLVIQTLIRTNTL